MLTERVDDKEKQSDKHIIIICWDIRIHFHLFQTCFKFDNL